MVYFLDEQLLFPPVDQSEPDGLLAVGGDLSIERLLLAYRSGIFPWYNPGDPILWWSPPRRMLLFFDELRVSKSMKKILDREIFEVTFNTQFREVLRQCQSVSREGQSGTWINDAMIESYFQLHELGFAKSVEVWQNGILVGGLYGIDLKNIFCGESMFSLVPNASKVAFIAVSKKLQHENYRALDCQIYNEHLESLGCREINRSEFLQMLS